MPGNPVDGFETVNGEAWSDGARVTRTGDAP